MLAQSCSILVRDYHALYWMAGGEWRVGWGSMGIEVEIYIKRDSYY